MPPALGKLRTAEEALSPWSVGKDMEPWQNSCYTSEMTWSLHAKQPSAVPEAVCPSIVPGVTTSQLVPEAKAVHLQAAHLWSLWDRPFPSSAGSWWLSVPWELLHVSLCVCQP